MISLATPRGPLQLPAFLPDGTRAVVRTVDTGDLEACGVRAFMVNTLHLGTHPGTKLLARLGGVHRFMDWRGVVATDSGGFQVWSLVTENKKLGSVSKNGFSYRLDKAAPKKLLTPEKCIQKQFQIGSDIMFCLDHCTHPAADRTNQIESVEHTVAWAKRCREEFDRRRGDQPPLLFAIVQGGADADLRRACAERLLEIGFDGYGFGGWPIADDGGLVDMVGLVAELVPRGAPLHGLGIGKPENVVAAFAAGYRMFDCVIPTRDARHRRLYAMLAPPNLRHPTSRDFYRCLYMQDDVHANADEPVDASCDCLTCTRYTRAYLYHLFKINDALALRLATIHNLRFYTRLVAYLATAHAGTVPDG